MMTSTRQAFCPHMLFIGVKQCRDQFLCESITIAFPGLLEANNAESFTIAFPGFLLESNSAESVWMPQTHDDHTFCEKDQFLCESITIAFPGVLESNNTESVWIPHIYIRNQQQFLVLFTRELWLSQNHN
eukprot:612973_1